MGTTRHASRAPIPLPGAILALALTSAIAASESTAPDRLESDFRQPPANSRILKIIHGWPDKPAQQDALIARLRHQGFGGVVCNVAFDHYLESQEQWAAFRRGVDQARASGFTLWLYDERGYPSGNAGGQVLAGHPDWEAQGLLAAQTEGGPGPIDLALPPGRLLHAAAYPPSSNPGRHPPPTDLTPFVRDNRIRWTPPAAGWRLVAITQSRLYEGTHAELNLWEKLPSVNLLEAAPTRRFIELTHDRYARELGPNLARSFTATFTDEPSLMSLFFRRMPWQPLPWSAQLPAVFRQRRGYPIEPILPDLFFEATPNAARHRHDFWQTIAELVSENFFGQIQSWCARHQLLSGGHLLAEEGLTAHVALYGDFFRCLRQLDAPGIDCLTSLPQEVPWHIARLAASAAALDNESLVMSETSDHGQVWRAPGDSRPKRTVTESEIRGTLNRLLLGGVNVFTSYYSWTDCDDATLRRLNDWAGRCTTLLRQGRSAADVAVVYPIESLWTRFLPAEHWAGRSPAANRIDHLYRATLETLCAARREVLIIDSRTLVEATVDQGALVHGRHRWPVVILPGVDTLPWAAWKKLERLAQSGGVVIALDARPANSESEFPAPRVLRLGQTVFGPPSPAPHIHPHRSGGGGISLPAGTEVLLPALLDRVLQPTAAVSSPDARIRIGRRITDAGTFAFIANESPDPWTGTLTWHPSRPSNPPHDGELWDPATGTTRPLSADPPNPITLNPYGAIFHRLPTDTRSPRPALDRASLPEIVSTPLHPSDPQIAAGEFVRGELVALPSEPTRPRPRWQANATLRKSGVDTFLFVRFPFEPPVDLSQTDVVTFDVEVPSGQRTPTLLLVIVQEADGGDFLASSPQSLSTPGAHRLYLPWSRFQLAGWSHDADGVLDLRKIREIRIGWGGYLGAEGESVVFSTGAPAADQIQSGGR
ncbi:MAG TPA: glycosyl hydrolase [Verrucomicrobiota bacterium]|nr:glycosyl hydrolase [Verrucomicrobiota bacterium]HNU52976.1 glycosyl hydrolase [Verrucomicrobiota bacterium]